MDEDRVEERIARVCQVWIEQVHPERIILFGFALNGKLRLGRDLEFLVVWEGEGFEDNRRRGGHLRWIVPEDVGLSMLVHAMTPEQFRKATAEPGPFTYSLAHEAKVLYESESADPMPVHDPQCYAAYTVRDEDEIGEVVGRICEVWTEQVHPERIFLFGSAARGDRLRESDLDFLVVWEGEGFENNRKRAAYLRGIVPDDLSIVTGIDVLVLTPEQFAEHISDSRTFTSQIVREAKVLYERVA